jgi:hypothetical protein
MNPATGSMALAIARADAPQRAKMAVRSRAHLPKAFRQTEQHEFS